MTNKKEHRPLTMSIPQAARYTGLSAHTITEIIDDRRNEVIFYRVGSCKRVVDMNTLIEYIEKRPYQKLGA